MLFLKKKTTTQQHRISKCEAKHWELLAAAKPEDGCFQSTWSFLNWGLPSHRHPSASKGPTLPFFFPWNGIIFSRPYLSSFCIVESSSSQLKISSLPALEGAGLFHQHPLFYDGLQNKERGGVKHTFYFQASFMLSQYISIEQKTAIWAQ